MPVPDPENDSAAEDGEVDPFEELGVQAAPVGQSVSDGLDAFMDDEENEEIVENEPVQDIVHDEEGDEDEDVFAALGVAGPAVALASSGQEDILAAFMDEDEDEEESPEVEENTQSSQPEAQPDAKEAYRMVLETVWVDGILDPGEVNLLARKREDLGLSFEEHLALVRDMLW